MDSIQPQFIGAPCGSHGPYTFYKAVKFKKDGKLNILKLGEFFYMKILDEYPLCIGEIQLLWEEKGTNQLLTSVRLYFQPRDTPLGTNDGFGDDEVLAMSEKLIVSVEDLVVRLLPPSEPWGCGRPFPCYYDLPTDGEVIADGSPDLCAAFTSSNLMRINFDDVEKERKECGIDAHDVLAPVLVMTYPRYVRYRTALKRVESLSDAWLKNILVMAIGGLSSLRRGVKVMFCREVFEYRDLEDLDFHLEHLAPNLKGRPRKRKLKKDDSDSNGYGSDHSSNASTSAPKVKSLRIQSRQESRNGITPGAKSKASDEEKLFLKKLYKFMAAYKRPIDRLPFLGYKQIDLYAFYKAAKRRGGYTKVCENRQWKLLYDEMGGHANNTSAATCTRRHYEKLILPYEIHLRKLHQSKGKGLSQKVVPPPPPLPPPTLKDAAQNTQPPVHNGQIKDKTDKKECNSQVSKGAEGKEGKGTGSCIVSVSCQEQSKPVDGEQQDSKEGKPVSRADDQTRTSTATNTGNETSQAPPHTNTPPTAVPQPQSSGAKVYKVEDLYHVEMKPTFVQRTPTLEVPNLSHRGATSITSPITPHKNVSLPRQADSPQHRAALPRDASIMKLASVTSHSSSSTMRNHDRFRKQQPPSSMVGGLSGQQRPPLLFNPLSAAVPRGTHLSHNSSASLPFSVPAPTAHNRPMPSLSHQLKLSREHLLSQAKLSGEPSALSLVRDPHVLASRPTFQSLQEPPPAHTNYVKSPMPPDVPPPPLRVMPRRTHKEMRANPVDRFPHPTQVLSRIHTQHHTPSSHSHLHTPSSHSTRPKSATQTPTPPASTLPLHKSAMDPASRYPSPLTLGGASLLNNGKDSGSGAKRPKSGQGAMPGSSKNHHVPTSSASSSSSSSSNHGHTSGNGGGGGGSDGAGSSQKEGQADRMTAEALQQQKQSEVLLQSALFGAQFTALPRPAQPSEAVPAFLPSLLSPHAAFALGGQAFPPTSAPSPLSLYQQLTPAVQAQLMAYSEEMMRQKALLSMTGSTTPFMMAALPGSFPQPPTKDSPQK